MAAFIRSASEGPPISALIMSGVRVRLASSALGGAVTVPSGFFCPELVTLHLRSLFIVGSMAGVMGGWE